MHRSLPGLLFASALVGALCLSTRQVAAQLPALPPGAQPPPGVQLPPGVQVPQLPGGVPGAAGGGGPNLTPLNLVDGFLPGETAYVAVDSLPLFDGEKLLADRFRRGDQLKIADPQRNPNSIFMIEVEFGQGDARRFAYVSRLGLAHEKPDGAEPAGGKAKPAEPANGRPKDDAAQDAKRIEGLWAVAGTVVMGRVNPGMQDVVQIKDIGMLMPGGFNVPNPQGAMPISLVAVNQQYYQFKAGKLATWSVMTLVDAQRKNPTHEALGQMELSYRLDPKKTPRRLDLALFQIGGRFQPTSPGIYHWEDDILVWAFPTAMGGLVGINATAPGSVEPSRPQGFQPDQLKRATVIYLMRVDPAKVAAPKAPAGTPAQLRGGNAF